MLDLIPVLRQETGAAGIAGESMSDPRQIHVLIASQDICQKTALDLLQINKGWRPSMPV
jgi:hypothetical protein